MKGKIFIGLLLLAMLSVTFVACEDDSSSLDDDFIFTEVATVVRFNEPYLPQEGDQIAFDMNNNKIVIATDNTQVQIIDDDCDKFINDSPTKIREDWVLEYKYYDGGIDFSVSPVTVRPVVIRCYTPECAHTVNTQ